MASRHNGIEPYFVVASFFQQTIIFNLGEGAKLVLSWLAKWLVNTMAKCHFFVAASFCQIIAMSTEYHPEG
jgi:hypothetical protein